MLFWTLVACGTDGENDLSRTATEPSLEESAPSTPSTGDTGRRGSSSTTDVISVDCDAQPDNVLRMTCDISLQTAGAIEWTFEPSAGGLAQTIVSDEITDQHTLTLWRLHAETSYSYRVDTPDGQAAGTFRTGALPPLADIGVAMSGSSPDAEDLLFQQTCGGPAAIIIDHAGQVVWYQDLAEGLPAGPHSVEAVNVATSGGILAIVDNERVRWFDPDGTLRLDYVAPAPLHHDVFERNGLVYVLTANVYDIAGERYVLDGVLAVDTAGTVQGLIELAQLVTPDGDPGGSNAYWSNEFPGAIDWSHANGIYVDASLSLYLSMLKHHTVIALDADPTSPTRGELQWVLEGSPGTSPWPADYAVVDPDGLTTADRFAGQHHPQLMPDGRLLIFDNGGAPSGSRALEMELDAASGEARITGSWGIQQSCPIQGAAYGLSNGNRLLTCMDTLSFYELDDDATVVRELSPSCNTGAAPGRIFLPRAVPVAWSLIP